MAILFQRSLLYDGRRPDVMAKAVGMFDIPRPKDAYQPASDLGAI